MSQQFFPTSIRSNRHSPRTFALPQTRMALPHRLAGTLALWLARSRQRRHLRELADWDDHLLRDIGVSREAALREAAKPFWRK